MPPKYTSIIESGRRNTATLVRDYRNDKSGSIAINFGISALIIFTLVGAGVDYGRWISAKSKQQQAMDAAALAAGRVSQITGGDRTAALAAAQEYYNKMKSDLLATDSTSFDLVDAGKSVQGISTATVRTPFFAIIGKPHLNVQTTTKAVLAVNGGGGNKVEVSMMLDVTGSMSGDKIDDLKEAAKDLVNIVVDDKDQGASRVAIAPFSEHVNVGPSYFQAITGQSPSGSDAEKTCVRERSTSDRYNDNAPTPGNYFNPGPTWGTCKPTATIVPLSGNKTTLKAHIDSLGTTGMTAGHLGTAWAWYLLSPKWTSVWPNDAHPGPYGNKKIRKYAVLMTDGEYNIQFSGESATNQARALCANIKAAGITVFTVGFQLTSGGEAYQTLQQCATSSRHFYDSSTGEALRQAFRDIALQISTLRLTN